METLDTQTKSKWNQVQNQRVKTASSQKCGRLEEKRSRNNLPHHRKDLENWMDAERLEAFIFPLHKEGNPTDINNCRGISQLPVAYKKLFKVLRKRIEELARREISTWFWKNGGRTQTIFKLKAFQEQELWEARTLW